MKESEPLELELQTVVSCHMNVRNQASVPCKSNQRPQQLSHLSRPSLCIFGIKDRMIETGMKKREDPSALKLSQISVRLPKFGEYEPWDLVTQHGSRKSASAPSAFHCGVFYCAVCIPFHTSLVMPPSHAVGVSCLPWGCMSLVIDCGQFLCRRASLLKC